MIHTNLTIAGGGKHFASCLIELTFSITRRKICLGEMTLSWLHPGNMSIGVERDSVGPQTHDSFNSLVNATESLKRQAVNQIVIDAVEACVTCVVGNSFNLCFSLNPIDRLLDARIKILDTEAQPSESESGERVEMPWQSHARI